MMLVQIDHQTLRSRETRNLQNREVLVGI